MNILKNFENEYNDFYGQKSNADEDAIKVGWKNTQAQHVRFAQLIRSFSLSDHDTIIDLGCGLGDLYAYIRNMNPNLKFNYIGYDILPEMITRAKQKYAQTDATFVQIGNLDEISDADYIFASGVFNLRQSISDNEWLAFIHRTITRMSTKARKGIAFNCLTSFSDPEFQKSELYYSNPMMIFEFCKTNLSKEVTLYHDYQQYDFTISISK